MIQFPYSSGRTDSKKIIENDDYHAVDFSKGVVIGYNGFNWTYLDKLRLYIDFWTKG